MSPPRPFSMLELNNDAQEGITILDYFVAAALPIARSEVPEYELRRYFGPDRTCIRREEIIAADAWAIAKALYSLRPEDT